MFGHISVLTRSPRRIEVRALTHGTLFRLDEAALRGLMGSCPELRRRIEERVRALSVEAAQECRADPEKGSLSS
jgi:monovalent cation:H+ antiporter, CPA1 family